MKQLVTFICTNGEMENFDYGIYDHKYSDEDIEKIKDLKKYFRED